MEYEHAKKEHFAENSDNKQVADHLPVGFGLCFSEQNAGESEASSIEQGEQRDECGEYGGLADGRHAEPADDSDDPPGGGYQCVQPRSGPVLDGDYRCGNSGTDGEDIEYEQRWLLPLHAFELDTEDRNRSPPPFLRNHMEKMHDAGEPLSLEAVCSLLERKVGSAAVIQLYEEEAPLPLVSPDYVPEGRVDLVSAVQRRLGSQGFAVYLLARRLAARTRPLYVGRNPVRAFVRPREAVLLLKMCTFHTFAKKQELAPVPYNAAHVFLVMSRMVTAQNARARRLESRRMLFFSPR